MQIVEITNLDRPELAVFAQLTQAQLRNRLEPEQGIFIAESPKVIRLALESGCHPVSLLMERRHLEGDARQLLEWCENWTAKTGQPVPVYTADRAVLAGLTGYALTRGVLCAMRRPTLPDVETICAEARRVAVLENIVDSTNVGAIFRSAAALGVDAVLVTPSCCDPLCRRAVRVSMGTVFLVPWTQIGEKAEDWPHPGIERLKAMGFRTVAMALCDNSLALDDPAVAAQKKLAIVLGTEGDGLRRCTVADCDYTVRIPMSHGVDSLNVAAAGAVAFWQLCAR